MAALGAAAGAFEGDRAREEAAARRAQLNLGHARLQEDARQFAEQSRMRQSENEADRLQRQTENAENTRRFELGRGDQQADTARQQANADRQFQLTERQIGGREQDRAFKQDLAARQEGRAAKSSEWDDVIKEQELAARELTYQRNRDLAETAKQATRREQEQLKNRKAAVMTGIGMAVESALINGGIVAKSALDAVNQYNKENGTGVVFTSGFMQDGQLILTRLGPAVDPNGQPIPGKQMEYQETVSAEHINMIRRELFGDKVADDAAAAGLVNQRVKSASAGRVQSNRDKVLIDERKAIHEKLDKHQSGEAVLEDTALQKLYSRLNVIDKYLGLAPDQPLDEKGAVGDDGGVDPRIMEMAKKIMAKAKQLYPNDQAKQQAWFKTEYDRQISSLK